jgi:hypothetical protein
MKKSYRSLGVPLRYLPTRLTKKDKKKQYKMLLKSRKYYKKGKGKYYTRKQVPSFQSKPSSHITNAKQKYGMRHITPSKQLAKKTGCSLSTLKKIVNKGEGAYYSSGSRPNQTAQSWGYARLASAITSGNAAAVDYSLLEKGCTPNSKALRLAKKAKIRYASRRHVPKVSVSGIKKKGGSDATQKGRSAEMRTYMNGKLYKDLSFIVHSGDIDPNKYGPNRFADPNNEYDPNAEQVITNAEIKYKQLQTQQPPPPLSVPQTLPVPQTPLPLSPSLPLSSPSSPSTQKLLYHHKMRRINGKQQPPLPQPQ